MTHDSKPKWTPDELKVQAFIAPSTWGILTDKGEEAKERLIGEVFNAPDAKRYADLFAASPALYRACEQALAHCLQQGFTRGAAEFLTAALAKARGETA